MLMSKSAPLIFKREWYIRATFNAFLIFYIPFFSWLTIDAFFFFHPTPRDHDVIGDRIVSLALLMCSPFFLLGRISAGDIHVDDDGIGWWVWGKQWLYIRW